MKNLIYSLIGILCLIFSIACKKDDDCISPETSCTLTSEYVPMAIGNYWIYEYSSYDPTTFVGSILGYDTIKIIADTMIRNHQYFVFEEDAWLSNNSQKLISYWRDSLGYIVSHRGEIYFTAIDFDTVLKSIDFEATVARRVDFSVKDSSVLQITPAGNFNCLDFKGHFFIGGEEVPDYSFHNCYAKDIGLIYQNSFYIFNGVIDYRRKLSEYHLE